MIAPILIVAALIGLTALLPPPPDRSGECQPASPAPGQAPAPGQLPAPAKPAAPAVVVGKNDPDYWKTGEMYLVVGASQSGKTYWTKQEIRPVERLMSWDIEQQYEDGCIVVRDIGELARLIRKNDRKLRVSYQPARKDRQQEFLEFCKLAFLFCEAGLTHRNPDRTPVRTYIVVEELASVTSVGKAPTEWGDLVRMGLKRNMYLYAITQRPTEIDKTTVGNCSQIHCCRVATFDDAKRMARTLSVPIDQVQGLDGSLKQSVHKNMIDGTITWGGLKLPPWAQNSL